MDTETRDTIKNAIEHELIALYETIRDYESDTFSARAEKITKEEITDIVAVLVNHALRQLSDCETLDGVRLAEELEIIRDAQGDFIGER